MRPSRDIGAAFAHPTRDSMRRKSPMMKREAMRPPFANTPLAFLFAAVCAIAGPAASAELPRSPVIHHDLQVTLDPANHRLRVRDRIRIPGALVTAPITVSLNADLA